MADSAEAETSSIEDKKIVALMTSISLAGYGTVAVVGSTRGIADFLARHRNVIRRLSGGLFVFFALLFIAGI